MEKKVVGIGDDKKDYYVFGAVFGNCEVVIPDTVTYIGDYAFYGCKRISKAIRRRELQENWRVCVYELRKLS